MRIKNDQAGLTLVELLVTIVVASIVTLAACTMLLFGLRINNQSTKTSRGQNTVQVLMEALEDVAAEAEQLKVTENVTEEGYSWLLSDEKTGRTFFSYSENIIYSGKYTDELTRMVFLENVQESYVTLSENGLLTVDVAMQQGNYSTSVYCRMNKNGDTTGMDIIDELNDDKDSTDDTNVEKFLKTLASQYGSKGQIIGALEGEAQYYSEWYIDGYDEENKPGWNKDTPWCACYVSWALWKVGKTGMENRAHWYASVDEFAKGQFLNYSALQTEGNSGDLVFFNFDEDDPADHVGVYLASKTDQETGSTYIYTIEGNTAGKVAVRKYAVGDPRIMGYGVLNWNS